ncbi:MAG TPA: nucleotidyl transferase AbiEii/AbiGii toxin family protein, partial [Gemmataceae bacterium]|nr:nucleotidyl transferase AbiEii/AbiGii toxin family protein [Gemmataceae bacterium]
VSGAPAARLRMCRPETIAGRKLHALMRMGVQHWRPKDLNDLRLLLGRVPMDPDALVGAITTSFTSRGDTTTAARTLFRRRWWSLKTASARWQDFVAGDGGLEAPGSLAPVVAEVAERLEPILDRLP